MKKIALLFVVIISFNLDSYENSYIDWGDGKIYSTISVYTKNDYNFPHNRLKEIEIAREKAKINYYKILKGLNVYESIPVINYIERSNVQNSELFSLIDNAILNKIEYPDVNTVRLSYYINIYGDNSLISIIMNEKDFYTENLRRYEGFNFKTNYTGIVIDARGSFSSYNRTNVKVEPCLFVAVEDNEGRIVFNQYNVFASVIKKMGMVRYSYDISENLTDRVGNNPYNIVAYGTGDQRGSILVISVTDAKRILASDATRDSIQNGRVVIIIDK